MSDITDLLRQGGGWFYVAAWLDRCAQRVGAQNWQSPAPPRGRSQHESQGPRYDNAHVESFWGFKTKLFDGGALPDLERTQLEFSDGCAYYNLTQHHPALDYRFSKDCKGGLICKNYI